MTTLEAQRAFFAQLITAAAGVRDSRLTRAFASVPRERFLGPGPWKVSTGHGYLQTPSGDPAFLYQDVVVALDEERRINNGQPTLHALCLAALNVLEGETVVHIGAGTGYYTAILTELAGPYGRVFAYEIDPLLAARASKNLAGIPGVTLLSQSGSEGRLPACNALYVSAGATAPLDLWLDALRPAGRLLFPLTPDGHGHAGGAGGMLLVTRIREDRLAARFVCQVMIIDCAGGRDPDTGKKLAQAFRRGDAEKVRSLRRGTPPDETAWFAGDGWWLSTAVDE